MSGFEFQVRTPLHSKQGLVVEKRPDGTHRDVNLSLVWPHLVITVGAKKIECGQEIIENAVVHAFPQLDGHVDGHLNGKKGYAFQCVHRRDSTTTTYFADSQEDRHEWCKLLRKHAVHHNIDNGFEVTKKVLGTGAYATVYLAKDRRSNEVVALKLITRERVVEEERKLLRQEVWVSQFLKTKYLVGTSEFIENRHSYVLVMEYVEGGELFERLIQRPFSEKEVQSIMRQVLKGVVYMHQKNIVHFDLKPENFLIVSDNPMTIKIADFGVSMDLNSKTPLERKACFKSKGLLRCSPGYGAPEIASMQDCGAPADMWSMGVVMYVLLTRHQPFVGPSDEETRLLMVEGKYDSTPLAHCSLLATDILARLLDKDTKNRLTAAKAMEHPWIKHDDAALGPGGPSNSNGTESIASGGATSISGGVTSTNVDRRSLTDFSVRKDCEVDVARWGVEEPKEEVEISGGCCGMFMGRRDTADNQRKYGTNSQGNQDNSRQSAHTKMTGGSGGPGREAAYNVPAPPPEGMQLLKQKTLSRANSGLVCPDEWHEGDAYSAPKPQGLPVAMVPEHTSTAVRTSSTLVRTSSTLVRANSGLSCGPVPEDNGDIVKRPVSFGERLPASPGPALGRVSKTLVRANSGLSVAEVCDGVEPSSDAAPAPQVRRREHVIAGRTVLRNDSVITLLRSNSGLSVEVDDDE